MVWFVGFDLKYWRIAVIIAHLGAEVGDTQLSLSDLNIVINTTISSAICIVVSTSVFECTISIFIEFTYLEWTIWVDVDEVASSTLTIFELINVNVSTTVYLDASAVSFPICI